MIHFTLLPIGIGAHKRCSVIIHIFQLPACVHRALEVNGMGVWAHGAISVYCCGVFVCFTKRSPQREYPLGPLVSWLSATASFRCEDSMRRSESVLALAKPFRSI